MMRFMVPSIESPGDGQPRQDFDRDRTPPPLSVLHSTSAATTAIPLMCGPLEFEMPYAMQVFLLLGSRFFRRVVKDSANSESVGDVLSQRPPHLRWHPLYRPVFLESHRCTIARHGFQAPDYGSHRNGQEPSPNLSSCRQDCLGSVHTIQVEAQYGSPKGQKEEMRAMLR